MNEKTYYRNEFYKFPSNNENAYIQAFQLISNDTLEANDIYLRLVDLWQQYRDTDKKFNRCMIDWIFDFCYLNNLECHIFDDEDIPLPSSPIARDMIIDKYCQNKPLILPLSIINSLCFQPLIDNGFYNGEYKQQVRTIIPQVFTFVDSELNKKYGIGIIEKYAPSKKEKARYFPYLGADVDKIQEISVTIKRYTLSTDMGVFFNQLARYTENELMKLCGYSGRLKNLFLDDEIKELVDKFFFENVNVSSTKRQDPTVTQNVANDTATRKIQLYADIAVCLKQHLDNRSKELYTVNKQSVQEINLKKQCNISSQFKKTNNKKISNLNLVFQSILTVFLTISILSFLFLNLLVAGITSMMFIVTYILYIPIYYISKEFIEIKNSVQSLITDCNELNAHILSLRNSYLNIRYTDYGYAKYIDGSRYNYKRPYWESYEKNKYIYDCSLSVCKNARLQPYKYLCKYFNISITEKSLNDFENIFNDFSAAEQGKQLLKKQKNEILCNIESKIPLFVRILGKEILAKNLGFNRIKLNNLYFPCYSFRYISPGGNSSMKCDITLDLNTLEHFIAYLSKMIKNQKTISGQRALMTSWLREKIKARDNYTCKNCGISVYDEPHLLLEIDHIVPLSKGGITTESNLQTLCWKCNRSKGNKIH